MIEVIDIAETKKRYDEEMISCLKEALSLFIIDAFKDISFRNSNFDTKFRYVYETANFFNKKLALRWYVPWNKYWTYDFKTSWLHDMVDGLTTAPFATLEADADIENMLQDFDYDEIICELYSIFPYMKNIKHYEEEPVEEGEDSEEEIEEFSQTSNVENLIPRKKKLKTRYHKKISYLYEITGETKDIEPIFVISSIKEIHNKRKGSIFFITIKAEIYDEKNMVQEYVTLCGYEEYNYIQTNHDRYHIRNRYYEKCKHIITSLTEKDLQEFDYNSGENELNSGKCNIVDVREGGSLNFYKFIKFWKML